MATFEEVGFLSDELDQWKQAARDAYADAFGYAHRANGMAMRVMKAIPMSDLSEAMKRAIAAFARATGAFQCAVLIITLAPECYDWDVTNWVRRKVVMLVTMFVK